MIPAGHELIVLGESMRKAQRAYFKERTPNNLQKTKRLEKRFDALIEAIKYGQQTLNLQDKETHEDNTNNSNSNNAD